MNPLSKPPPSCFLLCVKSYSTAIMILHFIEEEHHHTSQGWGWLCRSRRRGSFVGRQQHRTLFRWENFSVGLSYTQDRKVSPSILVQKKHVFEFAENWTLTVNPLLLSSQVGLPHPDKSITVWIMCHHHSHTLSTVPDQDQAASFGRGIRAQHAYLWMQNS